MRDNSNATDNAPEYPPDSLCVNNLAITLQSHSQKRKIGHRVETLAGKTAVYDKRNDFLGAIWIYFANMTLLTVALTALFLAGTRMLKKQ